MRLRPPRLSRRWLCTASVFAILAAAAWKTYAFALRDPQRRRGGISPRQLTGRIRTAESPNHLLFLVEEHEAALNEQHLSAAFAWLGRGANDSRDSLGSDPAFLKLLQRTSALVSTFRSQALSTVLWSLARVDYSPGDEFLTSVIEASMPQLQHAKPQELVNSLWACARFQYQPGPAYLKAVARAAETHLEHFSSRDVANFLWACARLEFHPGDDFLEAAVSRAGKIAYKFASVDLANLFWALAQLGFRADEELFETLLAQMEVQLQSFEPSKLTSLMWACYKLELEPSPSLLGTLPEKSDSVLTELGPRGLSFMLWTYGLIGKSPGELFLRRVLNKIGPGFRLLRHSGPFRHPLGLCAICLSSRG